jgi:hypothetical protein
MVEKEPFFEDLVDMGPRILNASDAAEALALLDAFRRENELESR